MTPRTKRAVFAVIVTAVLAVLIIQFAVPSSSAQSVSLNSVPGTVVLDHSYTFYVTINLQNVIKVYPNSVVTLSIFKSNAALVEYASFNGSGVPLHTGGFLQSVTVVNGTPVNTYGYGGSSGGYFNYKVAIEFASGGAVTTGQYSMNASVKINSSTPSLNSAPAVFNVASSPNTFPIVPIFVAADLVVIGVVVWVIMTMRRKR